MRCQAKWDYSPKDWSMKDGKILDTDPGRDLIVEDAVAYTRQDRHADDGERFHGHVFAAMAQITGT